MTLAIQNLIPEECTNRFSVMHATNGLCKNGADFEDLKLGAQSLVVFLRDAIGDNNLVKCRCVYASNGVSTEDSMREESVHFGSSLFLQELGCSCDGVGRIRQIIHQNGDLVLDITDEHHGCILSVGDTSRSTFLGGISLRKQRNGECYYLVDECKLHVQIIRNGSGSLCSTGVRTDDDGVSELGNLGLDVSLED